MLCFYLHFAQASDEITKVELPEDAIFNWYKVPSLFRRAFSGTKIAGFTLSGNDPDLTVVGKALAQMDTFKDFELQQKIDDILKPYTYEEQNPSPTQPARTLSNTKELDDLIGIDLTEKLHLTQDEADELIGSILGLVPVFILLLALAVVTSLYFCGYFCGCCCCCCPWDYSLPNICSNIAFIIGLFLIFLGGVFGCVSFVGFDSLYKRVQIIPSTANGAFDSLDDSLKSMSNTISDKFSTKLLDSTNHIDTFMGWIINTVTTFVNTFKEAINSLLDAPDATFSFSMTNTGATGNIETYNINAQPPVGLIPMLLTSLKNSKTGLIQILDDFKQGYKDHYPQIDSAYQTSKDLINTNFDEYMTKFSSLTSIFETIHQNIPTLDQLAANVKDKVPQTLGADIFTKASPFINNLYDDKLKSIVDFIDSDARPLADDISEYTDLNDLWSNVKSIYIALFFTIITMGIVFLVSFYTHCCCSRCLVGVSCCYPLFAGICCSLYGVIATIFGFLLVFVLQNVAPLGDSAVNAVIDKGIPTRKLNFPELSFNELTQGYIKKTILKLPNISIPQLSLIDDLLHSKKGTGIADFFSLPKILNLPAYGNAVKTFADAAYAEIDVQKTIEKHVNPIIQQWEDGDLLPESLDKFAKVYLGGSGATDSGITQIKEYLNLPSNECDTLYNELINHNDLKIIPRSASATSNDGFLNMCKKHMVSIRDYTEATSDYTANTINSKYSNTHDKLASAIVGTGTTGEVTLKSVSQEVDNQLTDIKDQVIDFFVSLLKDLYGIINTFKADPIVTVTGTVINSFGYDIPLSLTYVSLSVHLVLIGQFIAVIMLCIRRMGMKQAPTQFPKRAHRSSSSSSSSNEVSSSSSDSSSSSSSAVRKVRSGPKRPAAFTGGKQNNKQSSTSSSSSDSRIRRRRSTSSSRSSDSSSSSDSNQQKTKRLMGSSFAI